MEIMSENSKYALHEHMQQITTPLQVIWGKQDQVCVSMHTGAKRIFTLYRVQYILGVILVSLRY